MVNLFKISTETVSYLGSKVPKSTKETLIQRTCKFLNEISYIKISSSFFSYEIAEGIKKELSKIRGVPKQVMLCD